MVKVREPPADQRFHACGFSQTNYLNVHKDCTGLPACYSKLGSNIPEDLRSALHLLMSLSEHLERVGAVAHLPSHNFHLNSDYSPAMSCAALTSNLIAPRFGFQHLLTQQFDLR
jgi:hypothetical protein